ncbi:MAG: hypothetical protein RLZZ624_13 [Cyanobacteriota bacterium]|jgi:hypothetical protein
MDTDPELPPATPLTSPVLDHEGRLTYVGSDGRRYVVLGPSEQAAQRLNARNLSLEPGHRVYEAIERQARIWLDQVCGADLERSDALAWLFERLQSQLGDDDGPKPPPT